MNEFVATLLLTFKLAFFTTLILFIVGVPIAHFLAYSRFKWKPLLQAIISLPLVLPPTVIGYYLLVAFSPASVLGVFLNKFFDFHLAFSFQGVLLGSIIYSLPFMIHPIEAAFTNLPIALREAAASLGKSPWTILVKVFVPNIKPSLITALVITFAHTIGEFGIVYMIGGSIPGKTKVVSIAIFNEVEALNYSTAYKYSLLLFALSLGALLLVYLKLRWPLRNLL